MTQYKKLVYIKFFLLKWRVIKTKDKNKIRNKKKKRTMFQNWHFVVFFYVLFYQTIEYFFKGFLFELDEGDMTKMSIENVMVNLHTVSVFYYTTQVIMYTAALVGYFQVHYILGGFVSLFGLLVVLQSPGEWWMVVSDVVVYSCYFLQSRGDIMFIFVWHGFFNRVRAQFETIFWNTIGDEEQIHRNTPYERDLRNNLKTISQNFFKFCSKIPKYISESYGVMMDGVDTMTYYFNILNEQQHHLRKMFGEYFEAEEKLEKNGDYEERYNPLENSFFCFDLDLDSDSDSDLDLDLDSDSDLDLDLDGGMEKTTLPLGLECCVGYNYLNNKCFDIDDDDVKMITNVPFVKKMDGVGGEGILAIAFIFFWRLKLSK